MDNAILGVGEVERLARRVLGSDAVTAERHPVGFGNQNWLLQDSAGRRFVLKAGNLANEAKWRSSHAAYLLAQAAGVPVPRLVHSGESDGHLIRVFTWIEGESAADVVPGSKRSERLIRSVGDAVRCLHSIALDAFSSRLDGSAPSFPAWDAYISYRLEQVRRRCQATGAVDADLLDRACRVAAALAEEVTDTAEAVLCHRDLHPGNLIVDHQGALVGVIDWDAAEAWDRAGDWFKLEFELLRTHPDRAHLLLEAYLDGADIPPLWDQRRRLVSVVEALNVLPNAVLNGWSAEFSDRARAHLLAAITRSP